MVCAALNRSVNDVFGPLVVFGLGGAATEVLADHAARLTPLTDTDADRLIGSIRPAPLLRGHPGVPRLTCALRDLLLPCTAARRPARG